MTASHQLRRRDGPAAGTPIPLTRSFCTLGRHPASDIRLDTPTDQAVQDRHAAVFRDGTGWLVRDLGSTSGTLVNGHRIVGDRRLQEGDEIRLGSEGPALRFEFASAAAQASVAPAATEILERPRAARPLWRVAIVAAALGGAWVGTRVVSSQGQESRTRAALLQTIDSLRAALQGADERESSFGSSMAAARAAAQEARVAVVAADRAGNPTLDSLAALVHTLAERHSPLVRAAALDLDALAASRRGAVALVLAERASRSVVSGTGFAVASVGDTSWVVTSRHLVVDSTGQAVLRLGVLFDGTAQNFRASLERVHPEVDLALVRVVIRGGTPVVADLAETEAVGTPVATLTFPLGLDLDPEAAWRRSGVTASAFRATVVAADANLLELEGYGAEGMSGSPVFNARGAVVGVIFGGGAGTRGRVVLAVPAGRVRELLNVRRER